MKRIVVIFIIILLGSSATRANEVRMSLADNYSEGNSVFSSEQGKVKPRKTSTKKNTLKKPRQRPHQKREKGTPIIL